MCWARCLCWTRGLGSGRGARQLSCSMPSWAALAFVASSYASGSLASSVVRALGTISGLLGNLAGVGARVASSLCGSVRVGVSLLGSVASCGLGGLMHGGLIAGLKLCLRVNSCTAFDVAAGLGGGILARDVLRASGSRSRRAMRAADSVCYSGGSMRGGCLNLGCSGARATSASWARQSAQLGGDLA